MRVLKFGGSSVANAENINKIVSILQNRLNNERLIVVVSALGGITDALLNSVILASEGNDEYKQQLKKIETRHLELTKQLIPVSKQSRVLSMVKQHCNEIEDICNGVFLLQEVTSRTKDRIMSYGELLSSQIISAKFESIGLKNKWVDARKIIITNSNFEHAIVNFDISNAKIESAFSESNHSFFLVPGFIASDQKGITTTLGRGGSDFTAAIIAAALDAKALEIWTDVSGMMTADPRLVSNAKIIPKVLYREAMELSHFGAKVVYPPTIQPVMRKNIPVWIKSTFSPDHHGTLIENVSDHKNGSGVRGISSINKIALLSLEGSGMAGVPGFSKRLFETLANEQINVILITQSSSEHSICVSIEDAFAEKAKNAVDNEFSFEIERLKVDPLIIEKELAIIALVGDKMKSHPGISGKMFSALGRNGINVRAISQGSSERNISAVISFNDVKKAVNVLHEEFFETAFKQVNLFVAGVGNVGSRLLSQLLQQHIYLKENLRLSIRVAGIANSKKMLFNDNGIDLKNWREQLPAADDMNLAQFVNSIKTKNFRNSVFVDVTANKDVAEHYDEILQKSVSIVACNKIAASSSYSYYEKLKNRAREFNVQFLFETNVGAGLPVIGTLNDLILSGDKVNKIEAVLSGTLNFVFNNYDGVTSFSQVVRQAQAEGYTEPDPRLDLSGIDVVRKIMILARESGEKIEMEDVTNNAFMPAECMEGTVEDFYKCMEKHESHFKNIVDEANKSGKKLKFVATYENGKASVGLKQIGSDHDFYHLYGKDNVVAFYTQRYTGQPLVVKGAGAGADVTASGVFADIIRAVRI
ncbi:bifunctional aspartate kinase/homoserine dehydrogenase I [Hanamia caeni]|uniref:Bifunctional aspartate kinase/homoserine dehydrogenase I n=1 Tax=Hanamia caeni TaxID=2294116 RepID=A0A3M9NCV1_9BACT|nr:bifunctional aspartate kinase/homoserine dehydrogenase I [Hanamia caeni]RNI35652.1 bifunctional aspartate kinase/homoserine dehydrogenase I [Hanamia caeni]